MADSGDARATIVVVARDRFSKAQESLESVFANTPEPFELVYVDAGSPRAVRRWLEAEADRRGFTLLRHDHYLPPNEARRIGAAGAKTDYVVFLDNDVLVAPGWLAKLIGCADETGAAIVGPLTCEGGFDKIHFAGGEVAIHEEGTNGGTVRRVRDKMYHPQRSVDAVRDELRRRECSLAEYHAVLVRRSSLQAVGGPDPAMLSTRDHSDLCLEVMQQGGTVWFEPESVVAFLGTLPLEPRDMHFYALRWSDEWQRRSLEHFREKWDLADDEFFRERLKRLDWRRRNAIVGPIARRVTLGRATAKAEALLAPIEHRVNAWIARRNSDAREAAGSPAPPASRA